MTEIRRLADSVRKVAWGYLLIHMHIKINGVDLLADFVGWGLLWFAVRGLKNARPKAALLEGFAVVLGLMAVVEWLPFWEMPSWLGSVNVVLNLMRIYFDFQLLTELAGVAEDYREKLGGVDHSSGLLRARTWIVVLRTGFTLMTALPLPEEVLSYGTLGMGILQLGITFLMMANLFELAKCIDRFEPFGPEL